MPAITNVKKPVTDSAFTQLKLYPLTSTKDLDALLEKSGKAQVILLGEATHGTAEFYNWRAEISRRLIAEKGFTSIATEGDWADGVRVNDFINGDKKDSTAGLQVLQLFDRWPSFLWANTEFLNFMVWLNNYNLSQPVSKKVTFHGCDLFSISDAADTMYNHIDDPAVKTTIEKFRKCLDQFRSDERLYSTSDEKKDCSAQAAELLAITKKNIHNDSSFFLQAAYTIFNGERYLRSVRKRIDAWNIREYHMAESIKRLTAAGKKVIVWLHNTHAGDAFYSSTHLHNRTSVGEILRKMYGENVFLVGFGTYSGTTVAAETWGGKTEQMPLAYAENGTWEQLLHSLSPTDKYIILNDTTLDKRMQTKWMYTRSVGVLYHPNERSGMNLSRIAKRFDAYIYIDHTTPIHPLPVKVQRAGGIRDE